MILAEEFKGLSKNMDEKIKMVERMGWEVTVRRGMVYCATFGFVGRVG